MLFSQLRGQRAYARKGRAFSCWVCAGAFNTLTLKFHHFHRRYKQPWQYLLPVLPQEVLQLGRSRGNTIQLKIAQDMTMRTRESHQIVHMYRDSSFCWNTALDMTYLTRLVMYPPPTSYHIHFTLIMRGIVGFSRKGVSHNSAINFILDRLIANAVSSSANKVPKSIMKGW